MRIRMRGRFPLGALRIYGPPRLVARIILRYKIELRFLWLQLFGHMNITGRKCIVYFVQNHVFIFTLLCVYLYFHFSINMDFNSIDCSNVKIISFIFSTQS